ncbi:discoidin domain-containing protein [Gluconobacter thailandicus]|uniref:F5/8 type C domain-containing protein n=1 Tax=Gluconobacter thailandicus TaxID=257438 RepID=A0AAP9ER60_GLUTH|nr:discoidin domain-containing protein [Gluconobacter thailandicus]QEH96141.1 hypothetical protein FXF46_07520 [Gluconobacter thailandicus]
MLSGSETTTTEHVGRYTLSHYADNSEIVVVVFASAGARLGGPIEEFKGSLRKYGVSMLFVRDRDASWFHEPETPDMFAKVAEMVQPYKKVAVLGESMGGSGALIFPRFFDKIDRTLAFSPLYSFAYPFNQFAAGWNNDAPPRFWAFDSTDQKARANSVLLYGTRQWQDTAHAGLYSLQGYPVLMVKGSGHLVAAYLKKGYKRNYLSLLLEDFLDFSKPFNAESARSVLKPVLATYGIDEREWNFEASMKRAHLRVGDIPFASPPPGCIDLALNRPTDQSSICQYSAGTTTQEDSARAVRDHVPEFYAFHTDLENNPWWKIDLENIYKIEEIRIYNRIDRDSERGLRFAIEILKNGDWEKVFEKNNDNMFGGIDGDPFIWRPENPIKAREIRIKSLAIEDFLHYQKIEIFGR